MTRGQRNHNPLNIRRIKGVRWVGQALQQTDADFVQFHSDLFGLRAAFRILRTYLQVHHLSTLRHVVTRWAPPEDGNDTPAYVAAVCQRSGLVADQPLRWEDEPTMTALVLAMAWVESRMEGIDSRLLEQAYRLAQ